MKKLFFVLLVPVVLMAACNKEDKAQTEDDIIWGTGTLTSMLNGEPWNRPVGSHNNIQETDRFYFDGYTGRVTSEGVKYEKEILGFTWIEKKLGKQSLQNWKSQGIDSIDHSFVVAIASFGTTQSQGCANCESFSLVPNADNYVEITEEQGNFKKVKGIFNLTFYKTKTCEYATYPDTVRFTDGAFELELK